MSLRLYYTGATEFDEAQESSRLSIGGFVSSSLVPNDAINSIFGGISENEASNGSRRVRGLAIKNETDATISGATIWYENNSVTPITSLRMAIVTVGVDDCQDVFIEQLQNDQALPISASFIDNRTQEESISIPDIPAQSYVGLWIDRQVNSYQVQQQLDCDNLYDLFITTPVPKIQTITTVADSSNSLDGKYFFLDSTRGRYYVWMSTGTEPNPNIAGREGVRVVIQTDDTADAVAQKITSKITSILTSRGDVRATVESNIITITNIENGNTPDATPQTSGFTITQTQQGTSNSLEQLEDISIFINF